MIITDVRIVDRFDEAATWSSIRLFKNERYVAKSIAELHGAPQSHAQNIKKQARQVRTCITQAEEYFSAARSAGLATRPVLLYYGTLSLALAEILLKQSGLSSLDRAREKYSHHGLIFRPDGNPSLGGSLGGSANALVAKPLILSTGERGGTFALWHKSARENPMLGEVRRQQNLFMQTRETGVVCGAVDEELPNIPETGLTLLDCLQNLPSAHDLLWNFGIETHLVRGSADLTIKPENGESILSIVVHPARQEAMQKLDAAIKIGDDPDGTVTRTVYDSGFALKIENASGKKLCEMSFPIVHQSKIKKFYFSPQHSLNEFGQYYVLLFILGSYCRYYPDMWIEEIDSYSELASIANEVLEQAMMRVPSLALGELSRSCIVEGSLL